MDLTLFKTYSISAFDTMRLVTALIFLPVER